MQRTDESLAASPSIRSQEHVQQWAEGVYELFKAHHVELISLTGQKTSGPTFTDTVRKDCK